MGWSAAGLVWECRDLEIGPGPEMAALEKAAESGTRLSTLELLHLSTPDVQVIEGEVIGYRQEEKETTTAVVFRAVDSTSWDIEVSDESDFRRIKSAFPEAVELDSKYFRP